MRFLMVLNLQAGGTTDAEIYDFVRAIGSRGADVTIRFLDAGAGLEAALVDADRFDRVIAAGGDGTASATCYALRRSDKPVLVYPAGTANLLAMNLGMPDDPQAGVGGQHPLEALRRCWRTIGHNHLPGVL